MDFYFFHNVHSWADFLSIHNDLLEQTNQRVMFTWIVQPQSSPSNDDRVEGIAIYGENGHYHQNKFSVLRINTSLATVQSEFPNAANIGVPAGGSTLQPAMDLEHCSGSVFANVRYVVFDDIVTVVTNAVASECSCCGQEEESEPVFLHFPTGGISGGPLANAIIFDGEGQFVIECKGAANAATFSTDFPTATLLH